MNKLWLLLLKIYYGDLSGKHYWSIVEDTWNEYVVKRETHVGTDTWTVKPFLGETTFHSFRGDHIRQELWLEKQHRKEFIASHTSPYT